MSTHAQDAEFGAAIGIDFGTTNTVVALTDGGGDARLVTYPHDNEAVVLKAAGVDLYSLLRPALLLGLILEGADGGYPEPGPDPGHPAVTPSVSREGRAYSAAAR